MRTFALAAVALALLASPVMAGKKKHKKYDEGYADGRAAAIAEMRVAAVRLRAVRYSTAKGVSQSEVSQSDVKQSEGAQPAAPAQ